MLEKIRLEMIPILLEVLKEKDFGWEALEDASQKSNHPYGLVRLAFKDNLSFVLSALAHFMVDLVINQVSSVDLTALRTHEKIRKIIEISFHVLEPYKSTLRRLVNTSMIKKYFMVESKILYEVVSRIWYKAGDTSTDYNFYTKRILLSFAYVPTFRFWLKEGSTIENTMIFLDHKLQQVMKIGKIKRIVTDIKIVDFLKQKGVG
ncbi:MAG: COQ9 family protein [Alphaproteobacteria bacterium]|nr:COQ9 family protein [Alphaproteobacteria bacterium]